MTRCDKRHAHAEFGDKKETEQMETLVMTVRTLKGDDVKKANKIVSLGAFTSACKWLIRRAGKTRRSHRRSRATIGFHESAKPCGY